MARFVQWCGTGSRRAICAAGLGVFCAPTLCGAPRLDVTPADALVDTLPAVRASGFAPFERLTFTAHERDGEGAEWISRAVFYADADGAVEASASPSIEGTYTGTDPEGLFWSLRPAAAPSSEAWLTRLATEPKLPRRPSRGRLAARELDLAVVRDDPVPGAAPSARFTWHRTAADVTRREISVGAVRGVWFEPPPKISRQRTAVVVIDGSFGGIRENVPALLASRGWPAFVLGYFKYADRPTVADLLPLEYFAAGLDWARTQAGIDRVVLWGYSRGAEGALLTAAHFPGKLAAVIAVAPSHLVNNGEGRDWGDWITDPDSMWTLGGKPVACAPYAALPREPWAARRTAALASLPGYGISAEYRAVWLAPVAEENYAIPIERFRGRSLLIAGTADEIWPAPLGVARLARRIGPLATVSLHAGAGHSILTPGEVTTFAHTFFVDEKIRGYVQIGGSPAANAAAARAAWRDTLAFLTRLEAAHVR